MSALFNSLAGLNQRETELLNLMTVLLKDKPSDTRVLAETLGLHQVSQQLVNDIANTLHSTLHSTSHNPVPNPANNADDDLAKLINNSLRTKCCS